MTDWQAWHGRYDDPAQGLTDRLAAVQRAIRQALQRPGPVRVISACAGDGRDLLGTLDDRLGVTGRLVELDPHLAATAREHAPPGIEVVTGDASTTDAYQGAVPADLVLLCGIFGNVTDDDVRRTIEHLPHLCADGATVVWTRHRRPPDLTPAIREWFAEAAFEEASFEAGGWWTVGAHRFTGEPRSHVGGVQLFEFFR